MKVSRRFGFTIVELLVVISVILILVGLLSSGLSGAIRTGKTTKEMNRLKQLMLAWQMYSGQYADKILPGFLEQDGPTGVQQGPVGSLSWQVHYRNKRGQELKPGLCQTYPWRLAPYLDFNYDPFLGYRSVAEDALDVSLYQEDQARLPASLLSMDSPTLEGAGAALQPAFGYNAYYVGGWWAYTNNTPTLVFGNDGYTQAGASGVARGRLIATSQGNIAKPSELIVFAASTFLNQSSVPYSKLADNRPGAAWVVPHKLGQTDIWGFGGVVLETQTNASEQHWNDPILALLSAAPTPTPKFQGDIGKLLVYQNQAIPFARYGTQVSIGVADCSVRATGITSLNDLRLWVPAAEDLNFSHAP